MMVSSLDGRAAVAGSSRPLGGPVDLQLLLALRRRADALLVGPGTVRAEGYGPLPCPAVLVSRSFDLPWEAGLFQRPGSACSSTRARRPSRRRSPPRSRWCRSPGSARCSPTCAAAAWSPLLCEGGPTLNRALLAAGLLDELFLTLSPLVTGDDSQPAIVSGRGAARARAARAAQRRHRRRRAVPALQRVGSAAMRIEGSQRTRGRRRVGARRGDRAAAAGARRERHDRRPQRREGRGAGRRSSGATFVSCDVTEPEQVEAAVAAAGDDLRISVCCAGVGWAEKVAGKRGPHQFEPFQITVTVNLIGTFNVLRLAAAAMLANEPDDGGECGVIVNTASIAAYDGQIGQIAYAASKGGIVGMTLPAARDLASARVRVCTIAPGLFDTPLLAALPEEARDRARRLDAAPAAASARPTEYAALARAHRREPDAQRRGHPARRRAADGAALARQRRRTSTAAGEEVGRMPAAATMSASMAVCAIKCTLVSSPRHPGPPPTQPPLTFAGAAANDLSRAD